MAKSPPSSGILSQYEKSRDSYIAFTKAMKQLIQDLLASEEIDVLTVEARTKTRKSLAEKFQREDKIGKYSNLSDMTDITGIRIIAFLREDCERICAMIRQNFDVDEFNSIDKSTPSEVDRFGYSSHHIVASLGDFRSTLPEFNRFAELKAEFQVRTVLQHAWAVLDWKFRYKTTKEAPAEVRRKLFRISAFLEGADENFSEVYDEVIKLRAEYDDKVKAGDFDIAINADSLGSFLRESPVVNRLHQTFLCDGFCDLELTSESISRLLDNLTIFEIFRLDELENRLKEPMVDISRFSAALSAEFSKRYSLMLPLPMSKTGAVRMVLLSTLPEQELERIAPKVLSEGGAAIYRDVMNHLKSS